jgi:hypothetical protein
MVLMHIVLMHQVASLAYVRGFRGRSKLRGLDTTGSARGTNGLCVSIESRRSLLPALDRIASTTHY